MSCTTDPVDSQSEVYRYQNDTSFDIDITRYLSGNENQYTIAAGSFLEIALPNNMSGNQANLLYVADSALVVFDNSKRLWHKSTDARAINFLLIENYARSLEGDDILFEYTFTTVDYEAAD